MGGTIRSFNLETQEKVIERIEKISKEVASAMECRAEVDIERRYPPTVNPPTETEHIKRLAIKWFGPEHFSDAETPLAGSEDFSFFLQQRPGCFFTLGGKKPGVKAVNMHGSSFNFNDDIIATGGYFWVRLIEDRLGVKIFK